MPIRVLDAATIGRIAAGEVVERPSSVVKELIENSLDAGASSITVEIKGGGIDYLRVTDNGCGIEPGQVRLAFENHATSKLQRAEQLDDIRTLGFRGEALPSILAVSRIEMTTRAKDQDAGMKFTGEGGQNIQLRETGCPQGTTLIMRDLFFNIPVRRAFLKKASYEGGLVSDTVSKMLLGNPGVSMRFISGGNTLFHSFGDGKLRHAVFAVYGRQTAEKMIELDACEGGTHIHGLIGVGELAKATRAHQMFYINGRMVRCPLLTRVLEQVCRSRVTIGMYPMCILNLTLPPTSVDVNVHPNKLEVRFRDEDMMRVVCESLLMRAFEGEKVLEIEKETAEKARVNRVSEVREIKLDAPAPEKTESKATEPVPVQLKDAPAMQRMQPENGAQMPDRLAREKVPVEQTRFHFAERIPGEARVLREDVHAAGDARPVKVVELPNRSGVPQITIENKPEKEDALPFTAKAEVKTVCEIKTDPPAREALPMRVIGVLFKTYILVESGDTLLLIDQHAAHERLQYEKYMARAREGLASQQLLAPIVMRLSAKEMAVIEENLDTLADAGYTVELFGERDIQLRAVPFVMGKAELRPIFLELIQSLGELKAATVDARRSEIMQMACKSAVKAGDALTDTEIAALIRDMQETGAPPTCPHGRPVVKTITRRELEKMFKRIQ